MLDEIAWLAGAAVPALPTAALIGGSLLTGALLMRLLDRDRIRAAKALERAAVEGERLRAALFEPTAALPVVVPVRVRVGRRLQDIRLWARDAFTSEPLQPDWAEGEIKALTAERPPLRIRHPVAQARLTWPLRVPVSRAQVIRWTGSFGQLLPACARHEFLGVAR